MMDCVIPGGVGVDLVPPAAPRRFAELVDAARRAFPPLIELYDNTASLQDRTVGAGVLRPQLARQFGCGGFVGRASGARFRRAPRSAPTRPMTSCDSTFRCWRKATSMRGSGSASAKSSKVWRLIDQILRSPALGGPLCAPVPAGPAGEGLASSRVFAATSWPSSGSTAQARVERCHLRDPSWLQWPVLEAAIEGNIVADFPLCNKSFNCSYSGHDL